MPHPPWLPGAPPHGEVGRLEGARVTVFGGTGFVGRRLCADLADAGAEVLAVARSRPPEPVAGRFTALDLGLCPVEELAALLSTERPEVVVNATGSIWGLRPDQMDPACVVPTTRLLAALAAAPSRARLVHLGSVLEYGPIPPGGRTHPSLPPRPDTPYGVAKLTATREVLRAVQSGRVEAAVLRIANVIGPGTPAISLLGRVVEQLVRASGDAPVVELASLNAHRDYVDVRDVVTAIAAACGAAATGYVVDIGRGEAVPVRSLVHELIAVSGIPARLVERPGQVAADWISVDPEPARRLLGWQARYSVADAMRALWDAAVCVRR